jgi:hypothetical protein
MQTSTLNPKDKEKSSLLQGASKTCKTSYKEAEDDGVLLECCGSKRQRLYLHPSKKTKSPSEFETHTLSPLTGFGNNV